MSCYCSEATTQENSSSPLSSVTGQTLIDLFRLRLIVPSKLSQVVFVHLFYNSALFLPSCCCPFLFNIAPNLICTFLVSGQLVLLSALPKTSSLLLWPKRVQTALLLKNSIFFIPFSKGPNFASI